MTDKQPEALADDVITETAFVLHGHAQGTLGSRMFRCGVRYGEASQHATITAQAARIAELERDAARYRWLRVNGAAPYKPYEVVRKLRLEKLDAAIDAAMQQGERND